jgi:restriction system protein
MEHDNDIRIPTYDSLMNPVLEALRGLGGSATIEEINARVAQLVELSDEQAQVPHKRGRGSEVDYRLAWTRTYLKAYGLLDNSSRGVWSLTAEGRKVSRVDPREVVRAINNMQRRTRKRALNSTEEGAPPEDESESSWREQLLETVMGLSPAAFERLAQRILRESGFIQVEVTGRSGDGGIDGNGILRLGGLLSFHVSFQCKRWQGGVGPDRVREFRGAMMGRADKGLIITTGSFTKEAIREATREGAAAIDLIDGEQLIDKLKELGLGVVTRRIEVEEVSVSQEWFANV